MRCCTWCCEQSTTWSWRFTPAPMIVFLHSTSHQQLWHTFVGGQESRLGYGPLLLGAPRARSVSNRSHSYLLFAPSSSPRPAHRVQSDLLEMLALNPTSQAPVIASLVGQAILQGETAPFAGLAYTSNATDDVSAEPTEPAEATAAAAPGKEATSMTATPPAAGGAPPVKPPRRAQRPEAVVTASSVDAEQKLATAERLGGWRRTMLPVPPVLPVPVCTSLLCLVFASLPS
jgi:hypothetical protein